MLWSDLDDACSPVSKRCAGIAAGSERTGGLVLSESAGLPDVFLGEPDGVAIHYCGSVIAPTGLETLDLVTGEAILWANSGGGNLNIAGASEGIETGEPDAWIV